MSAHTTGRGQPRRGSDLGEALRRWRDRVPPAAVGLPAGRNRRAPGLRREELALLAGISAEYVVRLEQGRATAPSAQVLGSLARALRLSEAERRHLFALAERLEPAQGRLPSRLTPGVQRLLDQLPTTPVGVYDAVWTLIAWNRLHAALLGDPSALAPAERNLVRQHFTGPPGRVRHTAAQQAGVRARLVSDLRAARVRYPKDPTVRALVADLRRTSPDFAARWDAHEVAGHSPPTKTFHHPDVGPLELDCDILTEDDGDLRVVLLTAPPGSEAAGRLELLDVIGTQCVAPTPPPVPGPPNDPVR